MTFNRKRKKSPFPLATQNRVLLLENTVNLSLKLTSGDLHICGLNNSEAELFH